MCSRKRTSGTTAARAVRIHIRLSLLVLLLLSALPGDTAAQSPALDGLDARPGPWPRVDPAEIVPPPITARLLVDRSHGQTFDVSGLTGYLEGHGWTIGEHTGGPINTAVLADWDILLVPNRWNYESIDPFSADEVAAILAWWQQPRGLWLFHEYSRSPEGINSLSAALGVQFHDDVCADPTDPIQPGYNTNFWVRDLAAHPVFAGVEAFVYRAGCSLEVSWPAEVIATGDDDAHSAYFPSYPPLLASREAPGRAIFCGDITPLHPTYFPEYLSLQDAQLVVNIAAWLADTGPVSTRSISLSGIKALYR